METPDETSPPTGMLFASMPARDVLKPLSALKRQGEQLSQLQKKAAHNYFRVLQAYERLNPGELPASRGRQNVGELLTRELERERARIARELHAGAGQPLAGIKFNLELLRSNLPEPAGAVQDSLDRLKVLADEALEQVRAVSHRLYPPDWQVLTLAAAIESLWAGSGITQQFKAYLDVRPFPEEPSHAVKVTLYRCCQECLSNLMRHSGAQNVSLSLGPEAGFAVFCVHDDGVGFDARDVLSRGSRTRGIGLLAMREQVSALGGTLEIQSAPGGTELKLSIPLSED